MHIKHIISIKITKKVPTEVYQPSDKYSLIFLNFKNKD